MSHTQIGRNNFDDFWYDLKRLNRTQSEPVQTRYPKYSRNQSVKIRFRYQVASITTKVDSGQHDFFIAASHEFPNFMQGCIRVNAPAPAPNGRNDAKRAVRVTAVLNFYDSAGAAAGTEMRHRL